MRTLAIETIDKTGSVAALDKAEVLRELVLDDRQRSLQTLTPTIGSLLSELKWRPQDVELVAVATGPGSFTGLRIGVATAKTFAYAAGSQVLGVSTMDVLAAQVPAEFRRFAVVVDAQREELFVSEFERTADGSVAQRSQPHIIQASEWFAGLAKEVAVSGPGLKKWAGRLPAGVVLVEEAHWLPRASTVGRLAVRAFEQGHREELLALAPHYYRETAAEEQWQRKQAR